MIGRYTGRVEFLGALPSERCSPMEDAFAVQPRGRTGGARRAQCGPKLHRIDGVQTAYTADLFGANKLQTNAQRWSKQRKRTRRSVKSLTGGGGNDLCFGSL